MDYVELLNLLDSVSCEAIVHCLHKNSKHGSIWSVLVVERSNWPRAIARRIDNVRVKCIFSIGETRADSHEVCQHLNRMISVREKRKSEQ